MQNKSAHRKVRPPVQSTIPSMHAPPITRLHHRGRALVALLAAFTLSGCAQGVLDPKGPIARELHLILWNSTTIMLAVVIPVIILTVVFAWWFRASNEEATHLPDWEYSGSLEMVVWSIPTLVILFLGGIAWVGSHDLEPSKPIESKTRALEVQVVSLDWKWLFIYPEQRIASVNELTVPVGTPIHFRLTSSGVMNSFFIPQLGSQIYTMSGMQTQLFLQADHEGTYKGLSAQFSGDGFSDMHFQAKVVSAESFARWVNTTRDNTDVLNADRYATLERPGVLTSPVVFGMVEPDLFDKISAGPDARRAQNAQNATPASAPPARP